MTGPGLLPIGVHSPTRAPPNPGWLRHHPSLARGSPGRDARVVRRGAAVGDDDAPARSARLFWGGSMMEEARLEQLESGLAPVTAGWFVLNARDAAG